jgi:hypothetical protein
LYGVDPRVSWDEFQKIKKEFKRQKDSFYFRDGL